jgi:hypothetical protein
MVATAPVVSSDLFVVFATANGYVYAVRLDFSRRRPCDEGCDVSEWSEGTDDAGDPAGGWVDLFQDAPGPRNPVLSSPVIDREGRIYLTTGDLTTGDGVLHVIGRP